MQIYPEALESGHKTCIKECKRNRKLIWLNPPSNKSIKANVVKIFLDSIKKHFAKSDLLKNCSIGIIEVNNYHNRHMYHIISAHNSKSLLWTKQQSNVTVTRMNCYELGRLAFMAYQPL